MKRRDGYWLDGEYMNFFVYEKPFLAFEIFVLDGREGVHFAHGVSGCDTHEQMLAWMTEYDTPQTQQKYLKMFASYKHPLPDYILPVPPDSVEDDGA